MKPRVDRDVCIGSAVCVSIAPDVFELDDQGQSHVANADAGTEAQFREAAESCPAQAIILEDDQGNQIYPER